MKDDLNQGDRTGAPHNMRSDKGGIAMYPVWALIGLMLVTWGATIWAGYRDDEHVGPEGPSGTRHHHDGVYKDAA